MSDIRKVFEILETSQDWHLLQETVEKAEEQIQSISDDTERAGYLFRLAGIWEDVFARKDAAMKSFQLVWKAFPATDHGVRALGEARRIYRELGNLKMVAKLLDLELKKTEDPNRRAEALHLLGSIMLDLGQRQDALRAFNEILDIREDDPKALIAVQTYGYASEEWQDTVIMLMEQAEDSDGPRAAELYLSCARIHMLEQSDPQEVEDNLRKALQADPNHPTANFLLEALLAETERWADLVALHEVRINAAAEGRERARVLSDLALSWGHRFQNVEQARAFFSLALEQEPSNPQALAFFRDLAAGSGDWTGFVELCVGGIERAADNAQKARLASCLGVVYWHELNDLEQARQWFTQARGLGSGSPELGAFAAEHGLPEGDAPEAEAAAGDGANGEPAGDGEGGDGAAEAAGADGDGAEGEAAAEAPAPPEPEPQEELPPIPDNVQADVQKWTDKGNFQKVADSYRRGARKVDHDGLKVHMLELAAQIYEEKVDNKAQLAAVYAEVMKVRKDHFGALDRLEVLYEELKRYPDLMKVLKAKSEAWEEKLAAGDESVRGSLIELLNRRADLFLDRFSNQAEAIKVFESLLEVEPDNTRALDYLSEMYEKRRDWERLLRVRGRKAGLIADPDERLAALLENANLAQQRLKRPPVLIELWSHILEMAPDNPDALAALEQLYERGREWDKLGDILSRRVEQVFDEEERKKILQKMGVIFGDRISEPEKAIAAWRELLALDPDNRRAQDALKKKYLEIHDYDALEEFYAHTGKWEEFVRLLDREAGSADDPMAKAKITYKIGEIWQTKLDKADRAIRSYEKVFEFDPNNNAAALALIPIYQEAGKTDRLVAMAEIKRSHIEDAQERLALGLEIAAIYEQQLENQKKALEFICLSHQDDPTREDIRDEVERLAEATGGWDAAAGAFEGGIAVYEAHEPNSPAALSLVLRTARTHEERRKAAEPALQHYLKALEIDPNHPDALDGATRMYTALEQWEELLGILARKIELAPDDASRVELHFHVATVQEDSLSRLDDAIASHQAIIGIAGEDLRSLESLDRLHEKKEDWQALAEVMERELVAIEAAMPEKVPDAPPAEPEGELTEEQLEARAAAKAARAEVTKLRQTLQSKKVTLKYRQGQVLQKHLDRIEDAVAAYRDLVAINPKHEDARVALEGILKKRKKKALRLEIANILEPVYPHFEMWKELIDLHRIQEDQAGDDTSKAEVLGKIGAVQAEHLGDHKAAFSTLKTAFDLDPRRAATYKALESAAAGLENWQELVDLYRSAAGKADEALAKSLRLKVASLYGERLGDVEGAEKAFKEALAASPEDWEALDGLSSLYATTESWKACLDVYDTKIALATKQSDTERHTRLLFEVASIQEEKLEQRGAAIDTFRKVLDIDSANQDSLGALERLFRAEARWQELSDNLERRLELSEMPEETIELKYRLARLQEGELNDVGAAVETYREILQLNEEHVDTLAAMERLLENEDHQMTVSQILEPIYQGRPDWEKLIGAWEIQIKHSEPDVRVELLHKIARIREHEFEDLDGAFQAYGRALHEDAASQETQAELDRIAAGKSDYQGLVELYEAVAENVEDETTGVEMWTKIAGIHEDVLENADGAERAYNSVLKHDALHLDSIRALKRLYSGREKWAEYVSVLIKEADCLTDLDEQKAVLAEAARITYEVLGSLDHAIDVFVKVLEIDERDASAIESLERLYTETQRWEDLAGIYSRKADLFAEAGELEYQKACLLARGQVFETQMENAEKAIEAYIQVTDLEAEDPTALDALDRLYLQTEQWEELLNILEQRVALSMDADVGIRLKYRVGEVLERHLKDEVRGIETYREVLSLSPDDAETIAALERLRTEGEEKQLASEVLEPIYDTAGEFEALVNVYETMRELAEDPERRLELDLQIADLWESKLQQPEPAFNAVVRSVRDFPAEPRVLETLERLADGIENGWRKMAEALEAQLEHIDLPENAIIVCRRIARVCELHLEAPTEAIEKYRKILEYDEMEMDAIQSLDRLYQDQEDWEHLAEILLKQIDLAMESEPRINLLYRLAQLRQTKLEALDLAVGNYREILEMDETHGPTLASLEGLFTEGQMRTEIGEILDPLFRIQGDWHKLIALHTQLLESMEEQEERLRGIRNIAELYEEKLMDLESTLAWWGQAFREAPANESVVEELERLADATMQWEGVCGLYEEKLQDEELEKDLQKQLLLKLAKMYEERIADVGRSEQTYRRVLGVDEGDPDALLALDRIYEAMAEDASLAGVLVKRIEIAEGDEEQIDLRMRLGNILASKLGNIEGAVEQYNAIVELEPAHADALASLEAIYLHVEDWKSLYDVHAKQVDNALGDMDQAEYLAKMADLAAYRLGDVDNSIELWRRVLDLTGEDSNALHAIESLYEQTERWRDVVDVLERQVMVVDDDVLRAKLYVKMARVWEDRLQKERQALDAWHEVLAIEPDNMPALTAVAAIYEHTEAWEELNDTYERMIHIGINTMSDVELIELWAKRGQLLAQTLMRPQDAIDCWRQVLDVNSYHMGAITALEDLYGQEEMWEEAVRVLDKKAELLGTDEERIDVYLQIANIWDEKIGYKEQGASSYEKILEVDPSHDEATNKLKEIYEETSDWQQLVQLLLNRIEYEETTEARVEILQRVASIYERELLDPDNAMEILKLAFQMDYENDVTATEIERLAQTTGKWAELIGEYTAIVQGAEDEPDTQVNLGNKIARWYGEQLGQPEVAIQWYQYTLSKNDSNLEALDALDGLFRRTDRYAELVTVLDRRARLSEEPEEKRDAWCRLAEVYEDHLQMQAEAIQAYRVALHEDEENLDILAALERLYRMQSAWDQLIEILEMRAKVIVDTEELVHIFQNIADLWEDDLNDVDKAVDAYTRLIDIDPTNIRALRSLERLYTRKGNWQELIRIIDMALDVVDTDDERFELLARKAALWEEEFQKIDEATECYERILELDQSHTIAFRALERLYRQLERWEDLVELYRNRIYAITDNTEIIENYFHIGSIWAERLQDEMQAIEAFTSMLDIDPDSIRALGWLANLYEKAEEDDRALDYMNRLVDLLDDARQRVELYYRMGKIYQDRLGDVDQAINRYQFASDVDPSFLPPVQALRSIYADREDWENVVLCLKQAEEHTPDAEGKALLLYEVGEVYRARLFSEEQAVEYLSKAMQTNPQSVEAAAPLSDIYFNRSMWAEAEPLLDLLTSHAKREKRDKDAMEEQMMWHYHLAVVATHLQKYDKADHEFRAAYELDNQYLPTLLGMGDLQYATEQWDKAFKTFQTVLVHHRDDQSPDEIVDLFYKLGNIKMKLGEKRKALNMYEKALEVNPHHEDTLQAIIGLYEKAADWENVINYKRSLVEAATEEAKRFQLLGEIGDLWHEKLKNQSKAVQAYTDALDQDPTDRSTLNKLMTLYAEQRQWAKAIDCLERIYELEETKELRSKFSYTIAVIYRDELKQPEESIEYLNRALDDDDSNLKSFEAIDKILTAKKDWKNLERNYRKMIKRVPQENVELQIMLWHGLGEIYRSRMKQLDNAATAFEVASNLDPSNVVRHEILAELFSQDPDKWEKAVERHMILIEKNPNRIESFRSLYNIYMNTQQYDKAFCVAGTLKFLRQAPPDAEGFYEQYKQKGLVRAKRRLDNEQWTKKIYVTQMNPFIGAVFANIAAPVAQAYKKQLKRYVKKKEKIDLAASQLTFARYFNYVVQTMSVSVPELYHKSGMMGMNYLNAGTPVVVLGDDMLQGRTEKDLVFNIAKQLTYLRPEFYLIRVTEMQTATMKAMFLASLKQSIPGASIPAADEPAVATVLQSIFAKFVSPAHLSKVKKIMEHFVSAGAALDLSRWVEHAELTANRIGFILCGDIEQAAHSIHNEGTPLSNMTVKAKIADLVRYSISPEYFDVRASLGMSITG